MHAAPRRPGLMEAVSDPVPLWCRAATAGARRGAGADRAETVRCGRGERAWTPWT